MGPPLPSSSPSPGLGINTKLGAVSVSDYIPPKFCIGPALHAIVTLGIHRHAGPQIVPGVT